MDAEVVADYRCVTGENPLWHAAERRLYWVDIPAGRLFRYDPVSSDHEQVYQADEAIGGFTVQPDGALLLFMARGAVRRWRDGQVTSLIDEIPDERRSRFNDVIADPEGRVYCGTMPTRDDEGRIVQFGRLYRLDPDLTLTPLLHGVGISNGLGFTPNLEQLYFTDTPKREISRFDYDRASGALANRRAFVKTPEAAEEGMPDGMTVDADGYVWSARWDGSCLVRYAPDGVEDQRVYFPARKVSSVAFGGDDLADMYITTAGGDDREANGPAAGALFRLRPGVRGVAEFQSHIGL